jgi:hypothetical protein
VGALLQVTLHASGECIAQSVSGRKTYIPLVLPVRRRRHAVQYAMLKTSPRRQRRLEVCIASPTVDNHSVSPSCKHAKGSNQQLMPPDARLLPHTDPLAAMSPTSDRCM